MRKIKRQWIASKVKENFPDTVRDDSIYILPGTGSKLIKSVEYGPEKIYENGKEKLAPGKETYRLITKNVETEITKECFDVLIRAPYFDAESETVVPMRPEHIRVSHRSWAWTLITGNVADITETVHLDPETGKMRIIVTAYVPENDLFTWPDPNAVEIDDFLKKIINM